MNHLLRPGLLHWLVALLTCLAASQAHAGTPRDYLEEQHRLSMEFVTPHTDWAQPYAGGQIRVLFLCAGTRWGVHTRMRSIIELMQRFDIRADAAYWGPENGAMKGWLGGDEGRARIHRLLHDRYDVFLFMGLGLDTLEPEARSRVVQSVREGTGLVVIELEEPGPELQALLAPERRLPTRPSNLEIGDFYTVGQGRAMLLPNPREVSFGPGFEVDVDYRMEAWGRALLWAAQRASQVRLELGVEDEMARQALPDSFEVSWGEVPKATELRVKLRRWDGIEQDLEPVECDTTGGTARFELPVLRAGEHHVDAIATSGRGVEAWATTRFAITSSQQIKAVHLDRPWGEVGERLTGWVVLAKPVDADLLNRTGGESGEEASGPAGRPGSIALTGPVDAAHLDRARGESGERGKGTVEPASAVETSGSVELRLMDRRGRILVRQQLDARADSVRFSVPLESWMPMLLRVEAVLLAGPGDGGQADRGAGGATASAGQTYPRLGRAGASQGREIASAYSYFRVTKRHRGQFNFVMWNPPTGDLRSYGLESMAEMGLTTILTGGNPLVELAAHQISFLPYATWIGGSFWSMAAALDENGVMKQNDKAMCWNDTAAVRAHVDGVVERYRPARGHGVLAYSLGDEIATRGSCLSPQCAVAYREYLAGVYGQIEDLNASWGTDFGSFSEVGLSPAEGLISEESPDWFRQFYDRQVEIVRSHDEVDDAAMERSAMNEEWPALQAGNFPRWYDRQAYQCYNQVQLCKQFVAAFKRIDREAITGFEGTNSFQLVKNPYWMARGGDLDLFIRELDFWGPYPGPANEVLRSMARPGLLRGNWMGYAKDADPLLRKYWGMVLNGLNQVQWWMVDNLGRFHGFLAPHFGPFAATREMLDDTRIVRDGLGSLLMHCDMADDGIALLYSLPSTYIVHFDGNATYADYIKDHQAWYAAIRHQGLQFRYVTDRMLRLGEFDARRYRVLILPFSPAIGDEEAEVIRRFVRRGGTLIADVRPGLYDGRCKLRAEGALDEVFGVGRRGHGPADSTAIRIQAQLEDRKLSLNWERAPVDPGLRVTTGQPLGRVGSALATSGVRAASGGGQGEADGVPVVVVNRFGKGRAVLLNFPLQDAPADTLVGALLDLAGVRPAIQVQRSDGTHAAGVEVRRFQNDGIELIALSSDSVGEARVSLPERRYVYDLRQGWDLGRVQEFSTPLRPARPTFLALLPRSAPGVELDLGQASVAPGAVVSARVSVPKASGWHAVRLRAHGPDNRRAAWLEQVVIVGKEETQVLLPTAHNDPSGTWTIRAIDLYTNRAAVAQLRVEAE